MNCSLAVHKFKTLIFQEVASNKEELNSLLRMQHQCCNGMAYKTASHSHIPDHLHRNYKQEYKQLVVKL